MKHIFLILVMFALLSLVIVPVASAAGDVPPAPDLNSTIGQLFVWLVASGVIATGVGYLFAWFPRFGENHPELQKYLQGAVITILTALVTYVANNLPQVWLDTKLFDALVGIIGFIVSWIGTLFGTVAGTAQASDHDYRVRTLRQQVAKLSIVLIIGLSVLAVFAMPQAAYAETYDQMVYRMFAAKQAAHPEIWNACDAKCVGDVQASNNWWLKPLLAKINAKFPSYAKPITLDDLTRYAIVRSNEIAIRADQDCREGLIRDERSRGKWPTQAQFDKCKITADWWIAAYANNVEQTRADFDVSPMVFKVNEWPPYWKVNRDYMQ